MIVIAYQHAQRDYVELRAYERGASELALRCVRVRWADLRRPIDPDAPQRLLGGLDGIVARRELERVRRVGRWQPKRKPEKKQQP